LQYVRKTAFVQINPTAKAENKQEIHNASIAAVPHLDPATLVNEIGKTVVKANEKPE
jgi:hypothetical protein